MDINITSIKNFEGKKITLEYALAIKGDVNDDFKIISPIKISGYIQNFGGTLELIADGKASLEFICDRCTDSYQVEHDFEIVEKFKEVDRFTESDEDGSLNPEINYLSSDVIDIDLYVYENLVLSISGKHLCQDDCKGLCLKCGVNLNNSQCSCDTRAVDPRFNILDSLEVD